jgi:hypothetical protein
MTDLHKKSHETPEQWLARLERIDAGLLPPHGRNALALSMSYARHLVRRFGSAAGGAASFFAAAPHRWRFWRRR